MKPVQALRHAVIHYDTLAVRHVASLGNLTAALVAICFVPQLVEFPGWVWLSVAIMVGLEIVALAVPWQSIDWRWGTLVPLSAILAVGLFRVGTGGSDSVFGAILILPIIFAAINAGPRMILATAVTATVALLMPYLLGTESWDSGQLVRVIFTFLVFLGVAISVSEASRHARQRLNEVAELSQQRATLLAEAEVAKAELSRSAAELRSAEAFTRSIWEALENEALIVTDQDGTIRAWGPGATVLLGFVEPPVDEDAVARPHPKSIEELVSSMPGSVLEDEGAAGGTVGEHTESVLQRLVRIGSSPGLGDGELLLTDAAASDVPVFLSCSERRDAGGSPVGFIFVARDARYAQEIARLKDEFVGTISHELRTPLSSILGYLELVTEEDENLSDDQRRFLGVAERNAHRLLHLVGDLLFIAQVDGGKVPIEVAPLDLREIASSSAESISPVAATAGVSVALDTPSAAVRVRADARRIGQALDNLVSNAIKFTPPDGTVTISLTRDGNEAVLAVADTGMGISAEDLAQLAQRFFRTRMATRHAVQGVGLGLSITKAIVTAHGGTLAASSVVGEGTVFEIRLPVVSD